MGNLYKRGSFWWEWEWGIYIRGAAFGGGGSGESLLERQLLAGGDYCTLVTLVNFSGDWAEILLAGH